ncbi:MAG TPA: Maf family nucleotide pyrophosphatase [Steroidobacteraceae bacterium]|nr:Maf family nucleotide pyrophosphatase [Steroidobacteraceae bacterium]
MTAPALILASTSRYRRELLGRLGIPFTALAPGVDEAHREESPTDRAVRLAAAKAEAVALQNPGALVIGSDQVAACGDLILDKPGTAERAREQLTRLSGHTALFHTAVALRRHDTGFRVDHLDTVSVAYRELSAAEIAGYVERDRPLDCSASLRSESLGVALLSSIDSRDPTSLIGLPLIWLAGVLRQCGYRLF